MSYEATFIGGPCNGWVREVGDDLNAMTFVIGDEAHLYERDARGPAFLFRQTTPVEVAT